MRNFLIDLVLLVVFGPWLLALLLFVITVLMS